MPPPDDPFNDLVAWKFIGAASWHTGLFSLGSAVWHLAAAPRSTLPGGLLSPAAWLAGAALYATSLLVLYAQRRLLSSSDVPPVHAPRLGLTAATWAGLAAARCALRGRRAADAAAAAALYGAAALSGAAGVAGLAGGAAEGVRGGTRWLLGYGACLGLLYAVIYLISAGNVLCYPVVQRHRYFRVKQRLRAAARSALILPTLAAAAALVLPPLLPAPLRAAPPAAGLAAAAWRAGVLCAFVWACGAHVLEVVFTEPVAFAADGDSDPTRPLLAALRHPDPLVQDWALADLASVAEAAPGRGGRLAALFADETGANGWGPLVSYCLLELSDLSAVLAAAAAPPAAPPGKGGAPPAGVRWNAGAARGGRGGGGGGGPSREQLLAAWHLRGRYYRTVWCLRALSGLAAASLRLDCFGVAQLCSPGLGDASAGLLGAAGALQAHVRAAAAAAPPPPARRPSGSGGGTASAAGLPALLGRLLRLAAAGAAGGGGGGGGPGGAAGGVDPAALGLLDASKTAVYRVTTTFGPVLRGVVREAGAGRAEALEVYLRMEE
ncbi:MAG: hypothetical protein J3K34DRAFT_484678 [Monoraphidium minutum]|nr:MAG: hypothetical protein J3K34DRAFT_484678 [Monoraphidium minutum]